MNYFFRLLKYNPNHGPDGRFTTGPGDIVTFPYRGSMHSGKVVRVERNPGDGGSPFAVVHTNQRYNGESAKVPLHQIRSVTRPDIYDDPDGPANIRPYEHRRDED